MPPMPYMAPDWTEARLKVGQAALDIACVMDQLEEEPVDGGILESLCVPQSHCSGHKYNQLSYFT